MLEWQGVLGSVLKTTTKDPGGRQLFCWLEEGSLVRGDRRCWFEGSRPGCGRRKEKESCGGWFGREGTTSLWDSLVCFLQSPGKGKALVFFCGREGEVVLGSCGEGKEMVKRRGEGLNGLEIGAAAEKKKNKK